MWPFKPPVESPVRISEFFSKTQLLEWTPDKRMVSIKELFIALNTLAHAEISYYYKQRKKSRRISNLSRFFAWVFGTMGLLAPLIAATNETNLGHLTKWGYVLIAVSASFIAANNLFSGSSGHSRNVTAQLELERIVAVVNIDWAKSLSNLDGKVEAEFLRDAFNVALVLAQGIYKTIGEETTIWAQKMEDAINSYSKQAAAGAK